MAQWVRTGWYHRCSYLELFHRWLSRTNHCLNFGLLHNPVYRLDSCVTSFIALNLGYFQNYFVLMYCSQTRLGVWPVFT